MGGVNLDVPVGEESGRTTVDYCGVRGVVGGQSDYLSLTAALGFLARPLPVGLAGSVEGSVQSVVLLALVANTRPERDGLVEGPSVARVFGLGAFNGWAR